MVSHQKYEDMSFTLNFSRVHTIRPSLLDRDRLEMQAENNSTRIQSVSSLGSYSVRSAQKEHVDIAILCLILL